MKFTPYLNFDGQTREAFEFYHAVFGGKIEAMMTFGETPAAEHVPAEAQGHIMHACLVFDGGQMLMASDGAPQCPYTKPVGMQVAINIPGTQRTEEIFAKLAEGGKVDMPLAQTFWALRFGSVTDRFGTPWLVNCDTEA